MPAIYRRDVVFSESHYQFLARLKAERRIDVSTAIRAMIDHCLNTDPTLERVFNEVQRARLTREISRLEADLARVQETLKAYPSTEEPTSILPAPKPPPSSRPPPQDLRRVSGTENERRTFSTLVPSIISGGVSPRALKWWRAHLEVYPSWLEDIDPELRAQLEQHLALATGSVHAHATSDAEDAHSSPEGTGMEATK